MGPFSTNATVPSGLLAVQLVDIFAIGVEPLASVVLFY
jgi:hypothetical protein